MDQEILKRPGSAPPCMVRSESSIDHLTESLQELKTALAPEPSRAEPMACVFVASLNSQKSDEELFNTVSQVFKDYGPVMEIKVLRDSHGRPYAFVQYQNVNDAKKALENGHGRVLNGKLKITIGRACRVEQAKVNRTLFIARIDKSMSESEIRQHLQEFGPLDTFTMLKNPATGLGKGCCFAQYHYREDAVNAFSGLKLKHHWLTEWTSNMDKQHVEIDPYCIFVGQLDPLTVTEQELNERFSKYGSINSIELVNKFSNAQNPKPAFAFITFEETESAENAIEKENGVEWNARTLKVAHRELYQERPRFRTRTTSSASIASVESAYLPFYPSAYQPYVPFSMIPEAQLSPNEQQDAQFMNQYILQMSQAMMQPPLYYRIQ